MLLVAQIGGEVAAEGAALFPPDVPLPDAVRYPGFQVVGTTAHHEKTLSEVDFTKPTMLLIGNETEDYFLLKKENRRAGGSH